MGKRELFLVILSNLCLRFFCVCSGQPNFVVGISPPLFGVMPREELWASSWLCAQISLLAGLGDPTWCQGSNPVQPCARLGSSPLLHLFVPILEVPVVLLGRCSPVKSQVVDISSHDFKGLHFGQEMFCELCYYPARFSSERLYEELNVSPKIG